jgi:hypothetical protein
MTKKETNNPKDRFKYKKYSPYKPPNPNIKASDLLEPGNVGLARLIIAFSKAGQASAYLHQQTA